MGSSSGRARRRRKAQELLEREASHFQQVKRQNVDSEIEEEEGDHEVLFPAKTRESVASGTAGHEPVMSTPYSEVRNDDRGPSSITGRPSSPETIEFGPEIITVNRPAAEHLHRPAVEVRQGYRPAAPIQ